MQENKPDPFITDGKGVFYTLFESPLVTGYMPVPIPKGEVTLRWHGPKIHLERAWWPALKFMEDHVQHEVVLRLFMLADKSEIIIFPLSQIYGTGMSIKEEISTQERETWAQQGLIEAGTVHSHCDGGAFQSSTDKHDEEARDGLHLTIGKLKSDQFDIHSRMTWTIPGEEKDGKVIRASIRTSQDPNLADWFTFPDHVLAFIACEPELEQSIIKYVLTKPPHDDVVYPDQWKEKLIRKTVQATSPPSSWGPYHQQPLSMVDDIPLEYAKSRGKKKENNQNRSHPSGAEVGITQKESLIWDLWSEVMSMVADSPQMRELRVSVSDFDPIKRPQLIRAVPQAAEVWEMIRAMLAANNVSETEFFGTFDDRII
jgi:hypothetical protein